LKYLFALVILFFCGTGSAQNIFLLPSEYHLEKYQSIAEYIPTPDGYKRVAVGQNSFATFLRNLPVVSDSFDVLEFRNKIKVAANDSALAGIIPVNIKNKRLWQCMDIVLVFYAEYLKSQNKINEIEFPLPDGTLFSWSEWKNGTRPYFKGLNFTKKISAGPDSSQKNFNRYLNRIFEYSGTQTFYFHYPQVNIENIFPGDFIVKKGRKGHAVLIMDMAINSRDEKVIVVGQGDTPACQFYLLRNKQGSPWFKIFDASDYPDLPIRKKMYWSGLRRFSIK
jgi:hypothetical protein